METFLPNIPEQIINREALGTAVNDRYLPTGTELISETISNPLTIGIQETKLEGGNKTTPINQKEAYLQSDGEKGYGSGSTILYNSDSHGEATELFFGIKFGDGSEGGAQPYIGLGHELVHGLHFANGEGDNSPSNKVNPDNNQKNLTKEEVKTRTVEIQLQVEQGVKERALPQ